MCTKLLPVRALVIRCRRLAGLSVYLCLRLTCSLCTELSVRVSVSIVDMLPVRCQQLSAWINRIPLYLHVSYWRYSHNFATVGTSPLNFQHLRSMHCAAKKESIAGALFLEVFVSNPRGIGLEEQEGFTALCEERGYNLKLNSPGTASRPPISLKW